ncbi:hypothetical protein HWQ57_06215 [Pseudomonas aeruginosa]|uniref:Uncharacterized protein n=1 Tax=Pseudomonas fluorescens TaxID=294 RepID=A0A3S4MJY8_PSEFL|nr:hypothetical protein Q006_00591 [Pseudomonas aeruginosa UDL]ERY67007.1 hypothetical protein Q055_03884 [Pseudomonas aeruginosa BL01]QLD67611.1 hypothetical protein HWQ57_06215 [Pseudomonas aeruginosa]VEE47103.1 Uncharacterised protein [Pseudomonas fluorescens]QLD75842.1 hypothetical protein B18_17910 [Pseudomonas aeruginosa]
MGEHTWVLDLLRLLVEYGDSWKVWVGLAIVSLSIVIWRAKHFRFLIEVSKGDD